MSSKGLPARSDLQVSGWGALGRVPPPVGGGFMEEGQAQAPGDVPRWKGAKTWALGEMPALILCCPPCCAALTSLCLFMLL